MLSADVQIAMTEFGQVDVLIEMVIRCLMRDPADVRDKEWYEKLENALHLLEATYRAKKAALVSALEGGADGE